MDASLPLLSRSLPGNFHYPLLPIVESLRILEHGTSVRSHVVLLLRQADEPRDAIHVRAFFHRKTASVHGVR